jgi:predicted metal-binding protein
MSKLIVTIPTDWTQIVLACKKCSKKLHGGFGPEGDESLPRALKTELRATGRRRSIRVIETKCLGLCPKNAVTILDGNAPGAMLAIPAGTPVADLLARLPPRP